MLFGDQIETVGDPYAYNGKNPSHASSSYEQAPPGIEPVKVRCTEEEKNKNKKCKEMRRRTGKKK